MAELTFRGPDGTVYVKGSDVARSRAALDEQKRNIVELEFTSKGAENLPMPRRNWQDRIWESTWMRR